MYKEGEIAWTYTSEHAANSVLLCPRCNKQVFLCVSMYPGMQEDNAAKNSKKRGEHDTNSVFLCPACSNQVFVCASMHPWTQEVNAENNTKKQRGSGADESPTKEDFEVISPQNKKLQQDDGGHRVSPDAEKGRNKDSENLLLVTSPGDSSFDSNSSKTFFGFP
jgi:hypothetical protein